MKLRTKNVFIPKKLLLSDFLEKAGSAIFAEWQPLSKGSIFGSADLTSDEPTHLVASTILDALEAGIIQACILVDIADPHKAQNPDNDLLLLDEEDGQWNRWYEIDARYWSDLRDSRLRWLLSEGDFPIAYIQVGKGRSLRDARPDIGIKSEYTERIYILDANVSFGRIFSANSMPTEEMFRKYAKFNSRLNDELVMLGWRYLAIKQPPFKDSPQAKMIGNMREVLGKRGITEENSLGMSRLSLENITTRLLKQWKGMGVSQPVWINSSGKAPYSAPKANPRSSRPRGAAQNKNSNS